MINLPRHNRYVWVKRLQKSIFGEIQLAIDTFTQTHVAIKLSQTSLLDTFDVEHVVEDPRKEVKLINYVNAKGTSQNVIEVLDTFQVEDYECAVLPFCANGDLFEAVGGISPQDRLSAFQQIVNGVSHIHGAGVAHLDISLENILIDQQGLLKICDFGLARKWSDPCAKVGKLYYMAPEIVYPELQGDSYDARMGDMYSLGVCLFILCTGFQPYETPTTKCRGFQLLIEHGVQTLLNVYGVLDDIPDNVVALLEVLLCPLHRRANIVELQSLLVEQECVDSFFNSDETFNPSNFSFSN